MRTTQIGRRRARELKVTAACVTGGGTPKRWLAVAAPMVSSKYACPTYGVKARSLTNVSTRVQNFLGVCSLSDSPHRLRLLRYFTELRYSLMLHWRGCFAITTYSHIGVVDFSNNF